MNRRGFIKRVSIASVAIVSGVSIPVHCKPSPVVVYPYLIRSPEEVPLDTIMRAIRKAKPVTEFNYKEHEWSK